MQARLSYAYVFVDLKSAFASIERALVFPTPEGPEDLASRLAARGFHEADVRCVVESAMAIDAWLEDFAPRHLQVLLAHLHDASWFAMDFVALLTQSRSGSLAGSSVGDVVCLLAFARVMNCVCKRLGDQGLVREVPLRGFALQVWRAIPSRRAPCALQFLPAEYVDDVAVPVFAAAADLLNSCAAVLAIIVRTFHEFGLVVNCAKGKTEVMPIFVGPGKLQQQRTMDDLSRQPGGAQLHFNTGSAQLSVSIVRAYKHVGTTAVVGSSLQAELSKQLGSVRAAAAGLKVGYFANPNVLPGRKLMVAKAVCTTRGMFHAGTWPQLQSAEYRRFHTALMQIFRQASGTAFGQLSGQIDAIPSDQELLSEYGAPLPAVLLARARIFLFLRLLGRAPPELVALLALGLQARRSWFASVQRDVCRLFQISGPLEQWQAEDFVEWVHAAAADPSAMRKSCDCPLFISCPQNCSLVPDQSRTRVDRDLPV